MNPMEIILAIKNGKNPQQIMLNFLENNMMNNNPVVGNIVNLIRTNRTNEIEKIARNLAKEKGIDFDKEFNNFRNTWGL
jgi:hypothetical protein